MRILLFFVVLLLVTSCGGPDAEGYTALSDEVSRKLISFKEKGERAKNPEYMHLGVHGREAGGLWVEQDYLFRNVSAEYLACIGLGADLMIAEEGDSISYKLLYGCLEGGLINPWDALEARPASSDSIEFIVHIRDLQTFDEYQKRLEAQVNEGALEENAYLAHYVEQKYPSTEMDKIGDIYLLRDHKINNIPLSSGMEVEMRFVGRFLNDSLFTSENGDTTTLYFQLGKPDQVIKAFEMAATRMNSGEQARVFVPSHMGFGSKGSSTGIVPPKTPTYYDLQIFRIDSLGHRVLNP